MRVALISFDFGESIVPLANALAADASVLLVLPKPELEPFAGTLDPRVEVFTFEKPRLRHPLSQIAMSRNIVRAVRAFEADVVHLQQGHLWFNWALPVLGHAPLVLTIHDPRRHMGDRDSKTPQWVNERGFRRADRVIVHAEVLKREVVDGFDIPPERVHVVPLAMIDGPHRHPSDAITGRGGVKRVLFFGRIWPYKGLEYLIAAEPAITAAVPDVEIVIAGGGEAFERYEQLMVHRDRFRVEHGFVDFGRRDALFEEASVVVLPHVEATQSGLVPLSLRHGKPVVATTVGGIPEFVDDGKTGLLVPPRDSGALAAAINRVLTDDALRAEMEINARRMYETRFAPDALAAATMAVYRSTVGR
jgi:glycosyltransferase involved in cell wall biosynthesis